MGHHNAYDPRDPLSPAFYLTFIADKDARGGSPRDFGSGQGCAGAVLVLAILLAALIVGAISSAFTR